MSLGHNGGPTHGPSFDSAIADLLASGAVLAIKEWYDMAMIDKRLSHGHRVVMVEIATLICKSNSKEFPTQDHLVKKTGYTLMTLRRIIADLTKMGYLVSARRQIEAKKPAVAQYSLRRLSPEECQNAVVRYLMRERNRLQTIDKSQPKIGKWTGVPQVDGRPSKQAEYTNARIVGDMQLDKRQSSQLAVFEPSVPDARLVAPISVYSNITTNNNNSLLPFLESNTDNKKLLSPPASEKLSTQAQVAVDEYNVAAKKFGFRHARLPLHPNRRKALERQIKARGIEEWREALEIASRSDFCRNRVPGKDFKLDLSYMLQQEFYSNLFDGRYDNRKAPQVQQGIGRG